MGADTVIPLNVRPADDDTSFYVAFPVHLLMFQANSQKASSYREQATKISVRC